MMTLVHTLAVAEYLNFRHAANALGVAQSSVSARVKALEEDLGIVLFERHARGVRLTEAGRHFVERIAAGIDQLDHAVKTAGMAAAGESGRLRIGIHALIGWFDCVETVTVRNKRAKSRWSTESTTRDRLVLQMLKENMARSEVKANP